MESDNIKLKQSISFSFILFNSICAFLFFIGIVLSLTDLFYWKINWISSNTVGILCQIITAIVSFVTSTIGIMISMQNDNCLGISLKKFNGLRKNWHFSIKTIIITAIVLITLNLFFYLFDMTFSCISTAVITVGFCVYISNTEIPIMMKKESALIAIVKNQLMFGWKNMGNAPKELKHVIKYLLIEEYNLKKTYDLLSTEDKDFNKYLIIKLLDTQRSLAKEVKMMDATQLRREKVDRLIENIKTILNFEFDLSEILGENVFDYTHYITGVLFDINKLEEGAKITSRLIAEKLICLYKSSANNAKTKFIIKIALFMLSTSVTKNNFTFIQALKTSISNYSFLLGEDSCITYIFALMSLHLFYLYTAAPNVTIDIKNSINNLLDDEKIIEYTRSMSWRQLYKIFVEHFSLDLNEFYNYYNYNNDNWDVIVFGAAFFAGMNTRLVLRWFMANLFYSKSALLDDYNVDRLLDNGIEKVYLNELRESIFEINSIKIPEDFIEMIRFFLTDFDSFKRFEVNEKQNHYFSKFIAKVNKKFLEKEIEEGKSFKNKELTENLKTKINIKIQSEWGYDASVSTENEPAKFLHVLIEKNKDALYYESIANFVFDTVVQEIRNNIRIGILDCTKNFEETLTKVLDKPICAMTCGGIENFIKNSQLQLKFIEACKKAEKINSNILINDAILFNKFSFNFEFLEFETTDLSQEQINIEIKNYQRTDGQYVYEGDFLSREEIENVFSSRFAKLFMKAKYKVLCKEKSIVEIKLFPEEE